jgi:hypothetical protein
VLAGSEIAALVRELDPEAKVQWYVPEAVVTKGAKIATISARARAIGGARANFLQHLQRGDLARDSKAGRGKV